jgi:predicted RNA-binding Zn ribbon-like protein
MVPRLRPAARRATAPARGGAGAWAVESAACAGRGLPSAGGHPAPGEALLTPPRSAIQWRFQRRWQTADTLLQPVAEEMGDLACGADFRYVRQCERCTLWFLDVSRGHRRRWCSMTLCGNRAKAAAHRARG